MLQQDFANGTFTTPAGADTEAPQFKEFPRTLNTDTSSFTVFWETNEQATSFVEVFASLLLPIHLILETVILQMTVPCLSAG